MLLICKIKSLVNKRRYTILQLRYYTNLMKFLCLRAWSINFCILFQKPDHDREHNSCDNRHNSGHTRCSRFILQFLPWHLGVPLLFYHGQLSVFIIKGTYSGDIHVHMLFEPWHFGVRLLFLLSIWNVLSKT